MTTEHKPQKPRFVDWPVERMYFELYGRIPDWRILLHFACVNEDYA